MMRTQVIRNRIALIAASLLLWASAVASAEIPAAAAGVQEATQAQPPAEAAQNTSQESPQAPAQPHHGQRCSAHAMNQHHIHA